ncbi:MAG TPA: hypothetical protein VMU83_01100 [Hanamia sp.]|nr:hypothetical protein [Hanamia sp.]
MKRSIKIIGQKSIMLGNQLLTLVKSIIKGIVLPGRKQKGNLLTSIMLLFMELLALLIQFPWDFSLNFIKRRKYYNRFSFLVRKGLLITGCFLFLLSSIEWSYTKESCETTIIAYSEQYPGICSSINKASEFQVQQSLPFLYHYSACTHPAPGYLFKHVRSSSVSHYLLHRNFRI